MCDSRICMYAIYSFVKNAELSCFYKTRAVQFKEQAAEEGLAFSGLCPKVHETKIILLCY